MEELLRGKYRMRVADAQFRFSTDSMVLADFARIRKNSSVLDLGCGCGTIGFLLLAQDLTLQITGVEIQPQAAAAAAENVRLNSLSDSFSVIEGDLREYSALSLAGRFDAVISNPPYYSLSSGKPRESETLSIARTEIACSLQELTRAAAGCLRYGGSFTLVHKPERLVDLVCSLRENRLEPKRLRFVRHSTSSDVSLVLLEARLGGSPGIRYMPDLILFSADGEPTEDYRRIYATVNDDSILRVDCTVRSVANDGKDANTRNAKPSDGIESAFTI